MFLKLLIKLCFYSTKKNYGFVVKMLCNYFWASNKNTYIMIFFGFLCLVGRFFNTWFLCITVLAFIDCWAHGQQRWPREEVGQAGPKLFTLRPYLTKKSGKETSAHEQLMDNRVNVGHLST